MTGRSATSVPEDRPLTPDERTLVKWLLEHGTEEARGLLPQLDLARVASRCSCGCASVDFAIAGHVPAPDSGMSVVADFCWDSADGHLFGVFAFARNGVLAGIDLWSIDGLSTPSVLPAPSQLRPIAQ